MDQIFHAQSHWIWSKAEIPLNTVVADWKNAALIKTSSWKNENLNEVLVTVSTNEVSTGLYHKWNYFCLFWFGFGCTWIWLSEKFLQIWRWFFFFVLATRLSCKTLCTVTAKQHSFRFLVLKRNIQNVAASFALITVVETSRFIGWKVNTLFISTCGTIRISNSLLYFVVHTHFFLSKFSWLKLDLR